LTAAAKIDMVPAMIKQRPSGIITICIITR
jgi:hypothetical protein